MRPKIQLPFIILKTCTDFLQGHLLIAEFSLAYIVLSYIDIPLILMIYTLFTKKFFRLQKDNMLEHLYNMIFMVT